MTLSQARSIPPTEAELNSAAYGFVPSLPVLEEYARFHHFIYNLQMRLFRGLKVLYQSEAKRLDPKVMQAIEESDHQAITKIWNNRRIGLVAVESNNLVAGLLRVYDGTDYSKVKSRPGFKKGEVTLPREAALQAMQIKTDTYSNLRDQGYYLFEIGKYVLSDQLSPAALKTVRQELWQWMESNYLEKSKRMDGPTLFIMHPVSAAHRRVYIKDFGGRDLKPEDFNPPLKYPIDGVLVVDPQTLLKNIERFKDQP